MATSQTSANAQPVRNTNVIHTAAGQTFELSADFSQGGNAFVNVDAQNPYVRITGAKGTEGMNGQNSSVSVTFVATQPGQTQVTFVVSPRALEPLTYRVEYQIQIAPING